MQLTVRDIAAVLKVSEATVYRWIETRGLPAHEVNGHYRANQVQLLEWIARYPVPVSPQVFQADAAEEQPRLDVVLAAGGIYHDVPGDERTDVLAEVVRLLPVTDADARDELL